MPQTRSQIIRNNEKIIDDYEKQIIDLKSSINLYEELISKIQYKLTEKEQLIKVLLDEQDENSTAFENLCKENQQLKKKLAEKDNEVTDLQNEIINLNELNCTLLEENEEIGSCNTSIITPLKQQMVKIQNENTSLHYKLAKTIEANFNDAPKIPDIKTKPHKKEISNIIKNKNKKITMLKNKCKKYSKKKNVTKKTDTAKVLQENQNKGENNTQLTTYSQQLATQITSKNKNSNKITVIGDSSVRGIGIELNRKLGNTRKISCHVYSNAPLEKIFDVALKAIKENKEEEKCNHLFAVFIKNFDLKCTKKYYTQIISVIEEAENRNIQLLFNNIPYNKNQLLSCNTDIYKINCKLGTLALYSNMLSIVNLSNVYTTDIKTFQDAYIFNICQALKNYHSSHNNNVHIIKTNANFCSNNVKIIVK